MTTLMIERKLREYSWEIGRQMLPEPVVKELENYSAQSYNLFEKWNERRNAVNLHHKSGISLWVQSGNLFVSDFLQAHTQEIRKGTPACLEEYYNYAYTVQSIQCVIDLYNTNKQCIIDEVKIPLKQQEDIDYIKKHITMLADKLSAMTIYLERLADKVDGKVDEEDKQGLE